MAGPPVTGTLQMSQALRFQHLVICAYMLHRSLGTGHTCQEIKGTKAAGLLPGTRHIASS